MPTRTRKGLLGLRGKALFKTSDDQLFKRLTFQDIILHLGENNWILPRCQRDLDNGRVEDLQKAYLNNNDPNYFSTRTPPILLGIYDNKTYIIDGQHRLALIPLLVKNYSRYKDTINVLIEIHSNMDTIQKRFCEVNIDNSKVHVPTEELKKSSENQFYTNLKKLIKECYGNLFTKSSKSKNLYTLDDFMNYLHTNNFKGNSGYDDNEYREAFNFLLQKSKEFYESVNYECYTTEQSNLIYKCETDSIHSKFIYPLKRSNIRAYLSGKSNKPYHRWKQAKKRIGKGIKRRVWNQYTEQPNDDCPLCPNTISNSDFEAGHIISEANGGLVKVNNLIPICKSCNTEMGSKNLNEFFETMGIDENLVLEKCKRNLI